MKWKHFLCQGKNRINDMDWTESTILPKEFPFAPSRQWIKVCDSNACLSEQSCEKEVSSWSNNPGEQAPYKRNSREKSISLTNWYDQCAVIAWKQSITNHTPCWVGFLRNQLFQFHDRVSYTFHQLMIKQPSILQIVEVPSKKKIQTWTLKARTMKHFAECPEFETQCFECEFVKLKLMQHISRLTLR